MRLDYVGLEGYLKSQMVDAEVLYGIQLGGLKKKARSSCHLETDDEGSTTMTSKAESRSHYLKLE